MAPRKDLSLVVPIFNEVDNLPPLIAAIRNSLDVSEGGRPGIVYELLLVDDGSTDGSREVAIEYARSDERIKVVLLSKNFGQSAAMAAGFDICEGRYVVSLDGDLQNDPADIPRLLGMLDEGYDIVCGWRRYRKDRTLTRKLPSWIANRLISLVTGVRIHDTGCTLKAYRSWVVRKLHLYSDMHRFLPALAAGVGARVGEMTVQHHPRVLGTSKYGMGRIYRVLTDLLLVRLLVRFASHPVRYFAIMSMPLFLAGIALAVVGLFEVNEGRLVLASKWGVVWMASSVVATTAALNLFLLGLLSELSVNVSEFFTKAGIEVVERRGVEEETITA